LREEYPRQIGEGFPGPPEWAGPGDESLATRRGRSAEYRGPDSDPTGRIIDDRSRVCIIINRREVMRTLTVNEIEFVSGGVSKETVACAAGGTVGGIAGRIGGSSAGGWVGMIIGSVFGPVGAFAGAAVGSYLGGKFGGEIGAGAGCVAGAAIVTTGT